MSTPNRAILFRVVLYAFLVSFISNLGAMVDLVIHPEISYFDEEHLIVGGVTAITVILLLFALETHLAGRGKTEAALRESEKKSRISESMYYELVTASQDLVWQCDLEGRYTYLNPAWEAVFDHNVEDMLGRKFTDFQRAEIAARDMKVHERLLNGETVKGFETTHLHRDGRDIHLVFNAKSATDAEGKVTGTRGTAYDITDRKRVEEELKESEERLIEAQKVAHLGYYTLDVATGIWTSSKILDEVFGIGDDNRRDVEGWSLLIHPEDRQSMLDYFGNDVLEKKHPFDREYRIVRNSDKRVRWVHGLGMVEYDSRDRPVRMIGTIQDITERKKVEEEKRSLERQVQLAQKLESLGVLAGGIAHDFNNLLMVMLGHAELALKEISPMSAARGSITEIATAASRAADLCRQMLAYAGKASFALERVEMRDLVEEMAHLLKTVISKKAILNLNLERGLPPIEADPGQIRQIVMNLIINASEAIGDRSGVITVSVGATRCDEEYLRRTEMREALAPGLYVHLEVTDTGAGMDVGTRSDLRAVLFHEVRGAGAGAGRRSGDRPRAQGGAEGVQRTGEGDDVQDPLSGLDGRGGCLPIPGALPSGRLAGEGDDPVGR